MNLIKKLKIFYKEAYQLEHFPSFIKILFTNTKIFIYYGFLGDGNFGDELVFEASKELFKPHILLPYKKRMPIILKLFAHLFISKIAGVIVGGGTLIGQRFYEYDYFKKTSYIRKTNIYPWYWCS